MKNRLERIKDDSVSMKCPDCGKVYISSADCCVDEEGYFICNCQENS